MSARTDDTPVSAATTNTVKTNRPRSHKLPLFRAEHLRRSPTKTKIWKPFTTLTFCIVFLRADENTVFSHDITSKPKVIHFIVELERRDGVNARTVGASKGPLWLCKNHGGVDRRRSVHRVYILGIQNDFQVSCRKTFLEKAKIQKTRAFNESF